MDISKQDVIRLQKVLDDKTFDLLQNIASKLLVALNAGTVQGETAFLTAREAIRREERKLTLMKYLQTLEEIVGNFKDKQDE